MFYIKLTSHQWQQVTRHLEQGLNPNACLQDVLGPMDEHEGDAGSLSMLYHAVTNHQLSLVCRLRDLGASFDITDNQPSNLIALAIANAGSVNNVQAVLDMVLTLSECGVGCSPQDLIDQQAVRPEEWLFVPNYIDPFLAIKSLIPDCSKDPKFSVLMETLIALGADPSDVLGLYSRVNLDDDSIGREYKQWLEYAQLLKIEKDINQANPSKPSRAALKM